MRGTWYKLILACLLAGSLVLAGCGDDGSDGAAGKSAYELAVENGFEGTEQEWLASLEGGTDLVSPQAAETNQCITCHTSFDAAALAAAPFGEEVTERFLTSRHANQGARTAFCSACHSHEGGKALLEMDRFTSTAALDAAYNADTVDAYTLPVGSDTIVGVNKKTCSTCHTTSHHPTNPGLRGMGDTLDAEGNVVFSAEFNLCTACHMVDVELNDDGEYVLSDAYSAASMIDAATGTYKYIDLPNASTEERQRSVIGQAFYHDGASGNYRTMADTHFGGNALGHLTFGEYEGTTEEIEIVGYNINAGSPNACTVCHDPHTGGKLIAKENGEFPEPNDESGDNPVIEIAQNVGKFHGDYPASAWGYAGSRSDCMPCHNGGSISSLASGGDGVTNVMPEVASCRTCHDLAKPNAEPGDNNHAAFAQVREFPTNYEFAFGSGAVVNDDLGVDRVCFDCHKGRNQPDNDPTLTSSYDILYIHYAPAFATLYGEESEMFPTYAGKEYEGRFLHPAPNAAGSNAFGCVDCHNVHDVNDSNVAASKMTNPNYEYAPGKTCASCHAVGSLSAESLQARTEAYSVRLFETIRAEVATHVATNADSAAIFNGSTEIFGDAEYATGTSDADINDRLMDYLLGSSRDATGARFATNALAKAANIFRVLTYDDSAVHGPYGIHGHGGSWAHNSVFARQLMFDAIEDLGGDLTGLSRP